MDWVYRNMVEHAEECEVKNKPYRETHFLLDEFGNIPRINSFENKIATSRSRKIYFHLYCNLTPSWKTCTTSPQTAPPR